MRLSLSFIGVISPAHALIIIHAMQFTSAAGERESEPFDNGSVQKGKNSTKNAAAVGGGTLYLQL